MVRLWTLKSHRMSNYKSVEVGASEMSNGVYFMMTEWPWLNSKYIASWLIVYFDGLTITIDRCACVYVFFLYERKGLLKKEEV